MRIQDDRIFLALLAAASFIGGAAGIVFAWWVLL